MTAPAPTRAQTPGILVADTLGSQRLRAAVLGALGSATTVLTSILRSKVIAVSLGPAGLGVLADVTQYATMAATPAGLALGPVLLRHLGEPQTAPRRASQAFALALVLGIGSAVVMLAAGPWLLEQPAYFGALAVATSWQLLQAFTLLPSQILTSRQRFVQLAGVTATGALLTTLGVIAGVVAGGIRGQLVGAAAGAGLTLLLGVWLVRRELGAGFPRLELPDAAYARELFAMGAAATIGAVGLQAALAGIRDAAFTAGGAELAGQFQASWAIGAMYFATLLSGLLNFAFPRFATSEPGAPLSNEVTSSLRFYLRTVPPIIVGGIALRTLLLPLLYDDRFTVASELLGYQLAGDILKGYSWVVAGTLSTRGRTRVYLLTELAGAAALVVSTRALVAPLGHVAFGLGYVIGYALYAPVVTFAVFWADRVTGLWRYYALSLALAVFALGINQLTGEYLWLRLPVFGVATLVTLLGPMRPLLLRRLSRRSSK